MATLQGVYSGTVLDNRDREGLARVFVRVPGIADAGIWARIATMMAGQNRGTLFVPDVDDEVLVAFERGDQRIPYVIGALWNGKDKPPVSSADAATTKMIRSRSGVTFRIDDRHRFAAILRTAAQFKQVQQLVGDGFASSGSVGHGTGNREGNKIAATF